MPPRAACAGRYQSATCWFSPRLGVANQAIYLGIGFIALKTVSAGLAALIISSNPILAAVFAVFLLGERMTWRKVIGLLLGLGGVTFIVRAG